MTAPDSVLGFLAERGPAPTSEIAQALSEKYGYRTVRAAIIDLKKKGVVVDTGERHLTGGRPEHIVALERELERAKKRDAALISITSGTAAGTDYIEAWGVLSLIDLPLPPAAPMPKPTFIHRVKRWFSGK